MKIGLIVVAILVVFGIAAVGCLAVAGNEAVEQVDKNLDESTDNSTSNGGAGTAVEDTQDPVAEGPKPTCAYTGTGGFSGDGMQVELTFTNTLGEVNGLEVTYALLDGEGGERFYTGSAGGLDLEDIHFPKASEKFRLSVDTGDGVPPNIDETTVGCTVLAIEEVVDIGGYQRATEADTCKVVGTGSRGEIQVELAVTSPYKETTKVQTWWALHAPGPVRFETETEVVDLVGAGESFRITPEYGTEKPAWIGDDEVTCTVIGFWDQGR